LIALTVLLKACFKPRIDGYAFLVVMIGSLNGLTSVRYVKQDWFGLKRINNIAKIVSLQYRLYDNVFGKARGRKPY